MKGVLLLALVAVGSVLAGLPLAAEALTGDGCCKDACTCEEAPAAAVEEELTCCSGDEHEPEGPVITSMCGCGGHGPALVHVLGDGFRCPLPEVLTIAAFRDEEGELEAFSAPAASQRPLPEPPPPRS